MFKCENISKESDHFDSIGSCVNDIVMIETERLLIRYFAKSDAKEAHALFCDEDAMRMVGMYPPFTRFEETEERINRWMNAKRHLAIVLKETGSLIGYIVISPDSEECREDTREIGFALISRYRGQGYMKEAVNAVLKELARNNISYVGACCFKENIVSEKLIRSIGFEFQQEGTFDSPNDRKYESLEFRMKL